MTFVPHVFDGVDVVTAAGTTVHIPNGVHGVQRRSLVFRIKLGGREIDLTLAEFERLLCSGGVRPVDDPLVKAAGD